MLRLVLHLLKTGFYHGLQECACGKVLMDQALATTSEMRAASYTADPPASWPREGLIGG